MYIIIDELADLMTTQKKRITPLLQRIAQIGRAARVHLIAATQCPIAKIIPTETKANFTAVAGLHTLTRQHSRNIIDRPGCELLPLFGECLYSTPQGLTLPAQAVPQDAGGEWYYAEHEPQRQLLRQY